MRALILVLLLLCATPAWAVDCPPTEEWTTPDGLFEILHLQLRARAPFLCEFTFETPELIAPPLLTLARKPSTLVRPKPITTIDRDITFIPNGWHEDGFFRLTFGDAHEEREQLYHIKVYYRRAQ